MSEHIVQTIPIKSQQQYNRSNSASYNTMGMMTLPKSSLSGGSSGLVQHQHQLSSINYGSSRAGAECATLPRNMNSSGVSGNLGNL